MLFEDRLEIALTHPGTVISNVWGHVLCCALGHQNNFRSSSSPLETLTRAAVTVENTSTWPDPAIFPTCFRTRRCWLLPSGRLLLLSSASAPPTATWLCCAPPTGGRVSLLLFPAPSSTQGAPSPRVCAWFVLIFQKLISAFQTDSTLKGFWRKVRKIRRVARLRPSILLHLFFISPPWLPLCVFFKGSPNPEYSQWLIIYRKPRAALLLCRSLNHIYEPLEVHLSSRQQLPGLCSVRLRDTSGSSRGPCTESKTTGNYLALLHQHTAWWEFLPLFSVSGLSLPKVDVFSSSSPLALLCSLPYIDMRAPK